MSNLTAAAPGNPVSDSLAGKIAIVTGAARGIGYQIAQTYAAHGATVIVSDIDLDAARTASSALPGASANHCDVRSEASVAALVDETVARHGRIDIAVANAGIATVSSLVDMSYDTWRTTLSINLDGVFLTVKHAARAMRTTQVHGSIITMSSVTALFGVPLGGHYAAAKAGVANLTKTAALELRANRIRVNAILPGFVETELVTSSRDGYSSALGVDFDAAIARAQGGFVTVDDVANIALFLGSERSSFCTGGAYVVDGGLTASPF
jgi:NAD(P)-dependent dehydrogenase (short-subunit alcohol dehydrogenase family)